MLKNSGALIVLVSKSISYTFSSLGSKMAETG
jgi:hypothetical protein